MKSYLFPSAAIALVFLLLSACDFAPFRAAAPTPNFLPTIDALVAQKLAEERKIIKVAGVPTSTPTPDGEQSSSSYVTKPSHALEVSALQLTVDYQRNTVAADLKYQGQVIRVNGVVNEIDVDFDGNYFVTLWGTSQFGIDGVKCYLQGDQLRAAASLIPGQEVTVEGTISRKVLYVRLLNCRLASTS